VIDDPEASALYMVLYKCIIIFIITKSRVCHKLMLLHELVDYLVIIPSVGSAEVRSPRPSHVKYHVGQVVRHKRFGYRGVIIGWDSVAKVSRSFASVGELDDGSFPWL